MTKTKLLTLASPIGIAIASMAMPAIAHAQTTPPAKAKKKQAESQVIIVTAERKVENLQNYGGTAAVLQGGTIKALGGTTITSLEDRIPGVNLLRVNNNIEVYIRGVGSSNNTELGDPAAGTYLDGVYVPRPGGFGSVFFDINRVEVNYGPQGTLRGRNATAGTVNIIPFHPGLNTYDAYVEGGVGNYDKYTVNAMLNLPITDTMAIRLAGMHLEHSTWTHNEGPNTGLRGPEWANNFAGRAQLLWKPSDKFDLYLSYDNTIENGGGTIGTNLAAAQGDGIDTSNLNLRDVYLYPTDPHQHTKNSGEKIEANYHAKKFNVQLILGRRLLHQDWLGAPPGLAAYPGGLNTVDNGGGQTAGLASGSLTTAWDHYETQERSLSNTQELRITAPKDARLDFTVGAFHFTENQATFLGSVASQNAYFQGVEFNTRTKSKSWAIYTDDTFHLTPKVSLTAGVRYTWDSKERTGIAARYMMILGDGHYGCCMGPIVGSPGFQFAGLGRTDFTLPDPTAPDAGQQALTFYEGGIKSFGVFDTVPSIYPNGQIPSGLSGPCVDNPNANLYCTSATYNYGQPPSAYGKYTYNVGLDPTQMFAQNASDSYHFLDWRVRAKYQINQDHMVYALISTGHKAGGFNDNFGTGGVAPTYKPEKVTNWEIGTKNQFFIGGNPATFNLTGFYEQYNNKVESSLLSIQNASNFLKNSGYSGPLNIPTNFSTNIVVTFNYNAADVEIAGFQGDGGITFPKADIGINFHAIWMPKANVVNSIPIEDFRFQSDIDPLDAGFRSINGKRLPGTPEYQFNAYITKKFRTRLGTFGLIVAPGYRSSRWSTIFNGEDYTHEAYLAKTGVLAADGTYVPYTQFNQAPYNIDASVYRFRLNGKIGARWSLDLGANWVSPNGRIRIEAYANQVVSSNRIAGEIISQTQGNVAFLVQPTTYGMRLKYNFF